MSQAAEEKGYPIKEQHCPDCGWVTGWVVPDEFLEGEFFDKITEVHCKHCEKMVKVVGRWQAS